MKGGKTPIHIQRWAPADFQVDPVVQWILTTGRHDVYVLYRQFLDVSFMEGGSLPDDLAYLQAITRFSSTEAVESSLEVLIGAGKIVRQRGRLYHKRVAREIAHELRYRKEQTALGKIGGEASGKSRRKRKLEGYPSEESKGAVPEKRSPPAPAPSPAPSPAPDRPPAARANPLMSDRTAAEQECLALVRELSVLTGEDAVDLLAEAADYSGAKRAKCNPAAMSDDRLLNTLRDLRASVKTEQAKRR